MNTPRGPFPTRRHHVTPSRRRSRLLAGTCSAVLVLAACSDGGDEDSPGDPVAGGSVAAPRSAPPSGAPTSPAPTPTPATTVTTTAGTTAGTTAAITAPPPTTSSAPPLVDQGAVERADPSVFDYEVVRPVEFEVVSTQDFRGVEMQRIRFDSPIGGTAYGYLSLPVSDPVDAGILWGHGAPTDGTDSFVPMSMFACAGVTSVVVDAPYARPDARQSGQGLLFTEQDRDEQIQLIVDMRRALDMLSDLGATQLGFGGISYGASIGGLLLGVDHRPSAAVLLLGNGGVVDRFIDELGTPTQPLSHKSDEEVRAWIDAMLPIEPIRFIGDSTAELLFMSGDKDPLITPVEAERYYEAAPPGSKLIWMDEAHDIPFEDMDVHNGWLGDRLGVDRARLEACTDELFPNGWDDL